jgi:hypothetical protein
MKTKLIGFLATVGLAALAVGCDNPTDVPSCLVGRGSWVLKYTQQGTPGSGPCDNRPGDIVKIEKFQAFPQPGQSVPIPSLAIKPRVLRSTAATVPPPDATVDQRTDLAFGAFSSVRAQNNLCTVPTLVPAHAVATSGSAGNLKTHDVEYAFSNVTFLDDPAHAGTQLSADLTLTVDTSCVASYKVEGLYSINYGLLQYVIGVGNAPCITDSDCSAFPQPVTDPAIALNPSGSGIAPDYAVHCDVPLGQFLHVGPLADVYGIGILGDQMTDSAGNVHDVGACFLSKPFPSLCDGDSDPACAIQKPG